MLPNDPPLDLRAAGHLSGLVSQVIVLGATLALLAVVIASAILARRATRAARKTAALTDAPPDLGEGWTVLAGEIEDDEVDAPALEVDVAQTRVARRGDSEHWVETSRRVLARPFSLRLDDGTRIRVEPDAHTRVIAPLNVTRMVRADARRRAAVLRGGKRVLVTGRMTHSFDPTLPGQGYRDAGKGRVLVAPPSSRMLVSSESIEALAQRYIDRAASHARLAKFAFVMIVVAHATALWRFDALALAGRTVVARIDDGMSRYAAEGGSSYLPRYFLISHVRDGGRATVLRSQVSTETYVRTRFRPHANTETPSALFLPYRDADDDLRYGTHETNDDLQFPYAYWRFVPGTSIAEIGRATTVHEGAAAGLVCLTALFGFLFMLGFKRRREWWEGARLDERDVPRR